MGEVEIESLRKIYPGRERVAAVDDISLDVQPEEMLVLLGPSGCGKTTLLRCIAGLEEAQGGRITLGKDIVFDATSGFNQPTHLRDIGMVFQNYSLWPHMTVRRNLEYPLRARGASPNQRDKQVDEILEIVQCSHLAERLPAMLSGGQQQRIALARALGSRPKVMLLDEPLSNLDALLRTELRAHLRAIHRKVGFTGIYVTHDQIEAFNLGTRIAVMRLGKIEQLSGPSEIYERPATEYVASFLGIRNLLPLEGSEGRVTKAGSLEGDLGIFDAHRGPLNIYLRPNAVILSAPADAIPKEPAVLSLAGGRVIDTLYSGVEIDYVVQVDDIMLYVSVPVAKAVFETGSAVTVSFAHRDMLIYSEGRLVSARRR